MFFLMVGLWGLFRAVRGQGIDGSYVGALVLGQGLYFVQALVGLFLLFGIGSGGLLRPSIHILYGVFALVFIPFIYIAVLKGDDSNRGQWVMSFCALFMFGISLRAIGTGEEINQGVMWLLSVL
ncbi:MAG: hypothetical protein KDD89_06740 [Anaerolineales bacterium]|nr:hypothetical protein [Anaerolineales bacterium]